MRIAHIANFYGPTALTQIDQLHRSAATYQSAGHEFIAFIPSYQLATIEMPYGKIINLPSLKVPFTNGRRILLSKRLLKNILIAHDVDQIEIINQPLLKNLSRWAEGRNIKVLKSGSPVGVTDSFDSARQDLIILTA